MKNFFYLWMLLLVGGTSALAQQPILTFEDHPGNPLQEYVKTYRHTNIPKEFTGSFYLEEEFVPGKIVVDGKVQPLDVFLRYNALDQEVELKLKKDEDKVYVLPRLINIAYQTEDYQYRMFSERSEEGDKIEGYGLVYHEGDQLTFIGIPMAHMKDEQKPRSGYDQYQPAHLSVKMKYYLALEEGTYKEVDLKERHFRKLLSDSAPMKDYFSDNRIRSVEDVVDMLQHYEDRRS